jgi:hypothetical protein
VAEPPRGGCHGRANEYYRGQGFSFCGYSPISGYPSAALFQKPVSQIRFPAIPLFREDPEG